MILKQLSEVIWRYYYGGRASATNQSLREADINQMVQMAFGDVLRQRYFESKALNEEQTDFIGSELDIREYELSAVNGQGMRRISIPDEVIRLPRNSDIVNVYTVASGDCTTAISPTITQVQPGEENFYLSSEFEDFQFYVQKGRGLNFYHLPSCVEKVQVERIYADENLDIPLDIAFSVARMVLEVSLGVKVITPVKDNSYDGNKNELRYQLEKMEAAKV